MQMQNRTTILDPEDVPTLATAPEPEPVDAYAPVIAPRAALSTTWREPMIRGALAIVMGIVLVALPITAAYVFAIAFGIFVLVDGVVAIAHAVRNAHPDAGRWWAMILRGALGVVVGAFAILFPSAAAAALGTLIAIYAIVAGVLEISAAFRIRHDVPRETTLVGLGILTIVAGAILLFVPVIALVAQVYVVAAYAIFAGAGLVTYALRLRRRAQLAAATPTATIYENPRYPRTGTI